MPYKLILISLLSFNSVFSQNETDSVLMNQKVETIQPDTILDDKFLSELNDLKDSISELKNSTDEIKNSNNILTSILLGILTGIIASIITLVSNNIIVENRLKNKFKYLEGDYEHLVNNEIKEGCRTNIKYHKGGKLLLNAKTEYGNWNARIIMDNDIPQIGGGAFNYENRDERGFMQISVKDENTIYIFPFTLTHKEQKVNFYFLKRINV